MYLKISGSACPVYCSDPPVSMFSEIVAILPFTTVLRHVTLLRGFIDVNLVVIQVPFGVQLQKRNQL